MSGVQVSIEDPTVGTPPCALAFICHGGMDFMEDYRLVQRLREGLPTDMDVYDAAAWSAIAPLSEQSVAHRARTVDVPNFTRGRWRQWPPLEIVEA